MASARRIKGSHRPAGWYPGATAPVVEANGDIGVVFPEGLLVNGQRRRIKGSASE